MLEFMEMGGVVMHFVLVFGLLTVGVAVACVIRPGERRAAFFRALSRATLYVSLTGTLAGLAMVFHRVPGSPTWAHSPDLHLIVMTGVGEALSNAILGLGLLALAWFLFAFAQRRRVA